jgi:hypothetical protein
MLSHGVEILVGEHVIRGQALRVVNDAHDRGADIPLLPGGGLGHRNQPSDPCQKHCGLADSAKGQSVEGRAGFPGGGIPLGEGVAVAFPTAKELLLGPQVELRTYVKARQRIHRARAARDDHGMGTPGGRWMLAQASCRNYMIFGVPLSEGANQQIEGSLDSAVLKGVVEHNDSVASHFAKGVGPLLGDDDVNVGTVPKVLAHHEGFVADILRKVFELNLTHVFGTTAVTSAQVVHGIHLKVKLFHEPEAERCFAGSAHVKVAHRQRGDLRLVGRADPPPVPGRV